MRQAQLLTKKQPVAPSRFLLRLYDVEVSASKLSLADDHLVLDFPYDAEQIAEVRSVDGCKWDKVNRVWRAPIASLQAVRGFAAAHEFEIDNDVLLLTLPVHRTPDKRIFMKDGFIYLAFAYDRVAITSVKQIAGITWDKDTKAWKAPMTSVDEVIRWLCLHPISRRRS